MGPNIPYSFSRDIVGAGLPAITGEAGARHRGACIAGKPAPTGILTRSEPAQLPVGAAVRRSDLPAKRPEQAPQDS